MSRKIRVLKDRFPSCRGFTLLELVIVALVFAVLASLFAFSSQQVLNKAQVTRVYHDQRVVAEALIDFQSNKSKLPSTAEGLEDIPLLTTQPKDPFSNKKNQVYQYYRYQPKAMGPQHWLIISAGPDGDYDFDLGLLLGNQLIVSVMIDPSTDLPTIKEREPLLTAMSYDPTNGTSSNGDIIRADFFLNRN